MAYATQVTISTGNKVSINYQTRDVGVTVTYELEREDTDVVAVVREKTKELAQAHLAAWQGLHEAKVAAAKVTRSNGAACHGSESTRGTEVDSANAPKTNETVSADPKRAADKTEEGASLAPSEDSAQRLPKAPLEPATPGQLSALRLLLSQAGWNEEGIMAHLRTEFGCELLDDLSAVQAAQWLLELQRAARIASLQHPNASRNGK